MSSPHQSSECSIDTRTPSQKTRLIPTSHLVEQKGEGNLPSVSLPTLPVPTRLPGSNPSFASSSPPKQQQKQQQQQQQQKQQQYGDVTSNRIMVHLIVALLLFYLGVAVSSAIRAKIVLDANENDASRAALFNGVVLTLEAILACILSPLFGAVSDVIGRKPLLLFAHSGEFLALLLLAQFPMSLIVIFFSLMLLSISVAYSSIVSAIIADTTSLPASSASDASESNASASNSAARYGYTGSAVGICLIIGPIIGGYLEEQVYPLSSLYVGCVFVLLAFLYVAFLLPETLHTEPQARAEAEMEAQTQTQTESTDSLQSNLNKAIDTFKKTDINPFPRAKAILFSSPMLRNLAKAYAVICLGIAGIMSIFYIYVNQRLGWEVQEFGTFLTGIGFVSFLSQIVLTRQIIRTFGERWATIFGMLMLAASSLVYGLATKTTHMYIGMVLAAPGFVVDPAIKGVLARKAPSHEQGGLQGSFSALGNIVKSVSPLLSNLLLSLGLAIGWLGLPLMLFAVVKLLSIYFLWKAFSYSDS